MAWMALAIRIVSGPVPVKRGNLTSGSVQKHLSGKATNQDFEEQPSQKPQQHAVFLIGSSSG